MCFQPLKILSSHENALPLEGGLTLRREAFQTCGVVPRSGGLCRQTAKSKVISEKEETKGRRNPKLDPAVFRTPSVSARRNTTFPLHVREVGRLRQVGLPQGALLRAAVQGAESGQDAGGLLPNCPIFHAQFRAIGTNYNQVVKELRLHFSEKKAMALLYKLEQQTVELVKLSAGLWNFRSRCRKMVAKIGVGKSLYGALAQRGKINEGERAAAHHQPHLNDGSGTVDIHRAMEGFSRLMPGAGRREETGGPYLAQSASRRCFDRTQNLQDIAREYLEKGVRQPAVSCFQARGHDRHHLHIVTVNVDEKGRRHRPEFFHRSGR